MCGKQFSCSCKSLCRQWQRRLGSSTIIKSWLNVAWVAASSKLPRSAHFIAHHLPVIHTLPDCCCVCVYVCVWVHLSVNAAASVATSHIWQLPAPSLSRSLLSGFFLQHVQAPFPSPAPPPPPHSLGAGNHNFTTSATVGNQSANVFCQLPATKLAPIAEMLENILRTLQINA